MEKRLILFLTPSVKLLGARRSLLSLAQSLAPPYCAHVVCSNSGALTNELIRLNIPNTIIKHYNWRKGKFFLHRINQAYKLRRLIDELKPDIIHANEFHSLPVALYARGSREIPIVVHHRLYISMKQIKNYKLNKADKIIAVSEGAAHDFDRSDCAGKVSVVYNGIALDDFKRTPEIDEEGRLLRKRLSIDEDDFVVGLIGLIGERKRQHIALEAANIVVRQNPKCHFIFAGDASKSMQEYKESLSGIIEKYSLLKNAHILPFTMKIQPVYAAMNLNLLISSEEGFGRTIIEAGGMEIPSIGTKIGGIPELIRDKETGFLIDLDDYKTLADKIMPLSRNPELARSLGKKALEYTSKNFTLQAMMQNTMKIYDALLS